MKQIIVAVVFFSLMACGKKDTVAPTPTPKPDTTVVVKKAGLIIAQFLDGKKLFDYTYNDSGRVIKINHYNDEVGALDTIKNITNLEYNTKGLIARISSRNPDSAFTQELEEITYDANGDQINRKRQYYDSRESKYKLEDNWVRKNVIYDANKRITLIDAERQTNYDTTQQKQEYKYDAAGNIIEYTISYFDKIENKFIINENVKIDYYQDILMPTALLIDAPYPLSQIKKLYKKMVTDDKYDLSTTTVTILERDVKNNPTKMKIDESSTSKRDGSMNTSSSLSTLTYKQ